MVKILWCDYSNEFSLQVSSHGAIYLVYNSNFWVCRGNPLVLPFRENHMVWPFKWIILFSSIFTWCYLFRIKFSLLSLWWKSYGVTIQMNSLYKYLRMVLFIWYIILTFGSVEEILWCYHSNEFSSAVFSDGAICFPTFYKVRLGNFA